MTDIGYELEHEAAKILAEEIDWEIMCELMKSVGWIQVETDSPATNITTWCTDNLKGKFKNRNQQWMFERVEDANWFALRWSA